MRWDVDEWRLLCGGVWNESKVVRIGEECVMLWVGVLSCVVGWHRVGSCKGVDKVGMGTSDGRWWVEVLSGDDGLLRLGVSLGVEIGGIDTTWGFAWEFVLTGVKGSWLVGKACGVEKWGPIKWVFIMRSRCLWVERKNIFNKYDMAGNFAWGKIIVFIGVIAIFFTSSFY